MRRLCRLYGERPSERREEMPPGGPCGVREAGDAARGAVRRTRSRRCRPGGRAAYEKQAINGRVSFWQHSHNGCGQMANGVVQ